MLLPFRFTSVASDSSRPACVTASRMLPPVVSSGPAIVACNDAASNGLSSTRRPVARPRRSIPGAAPVPDSAASIVRLPASGMPAMPLSAARSGAVSCTPPPKD